MSEIQERFSRHYAKATGENCWEWTSSRSAAGYGRFMLGGKSRIASRVAYELAFGPVPNGLCVMHLCDNRACVNPSHLRLGTHLENMKDRNAKGRARGGSLSGESSPRSKLSTSQATEIRSLATDSDLPQRAIANIYGVSQSVVSRIKNGKTW